MSVNMNAFLLGQAVRAYLVGRGAGSKTPVAYLYNGVQLPALPEWDRETYPYIFMDKRKPLYSDATYYLTMVASPFTKTTKDGAVVINYTLPRLGCYYKLSEGVWSAVSEYTNGGTITNPTSVWSNHDILDENGTVYLAASEPIPVYE